jgi:hypothetical protein
MGWLAASQVIAAGVLPIVLAAVIGLELPRLSSILALHGGRVIDPAGITVARTILWAAAGVGFVIAVVLSWRAWRRGSNFEAAAERIDERLGARQEILTLATLAAPGRERKVESRPALFAMLWRRCISYLEKLDPRREFRFEPKIVIKESAVWFGATMLLLAMVFLSVVRAQTPLEAAASSIRQLANNLDQSGGSPEHSDRAAAARAVANDLENPHLPPEQKLAELQSFRRELAKSEQQNGAHSASAGSSSSGNGSASGKGTGAGAGGENASGSGAGRAGSGNAGAGSGAGQNQPNGPRNQQNLELHNKLARAEAKLEEQSKSGEKTEVAEKQGPDKQGAAPQAGNNPNRPGPEAKPNGAGDQQLPEPGKLAQNQTPPSSNGASAHKNDNGSQGDTHLGDFPKAANYDRYYKLGEKGPVLDIRDARYVTFRIPPATVAKGGAGALTPDSASPSATTPYTNVPLKQQRLAAAPDEEQLVPPRYRDLLK